MAIQKTSLDEVLDKFSMFGRYHLEFMLVTMITFAYTAMFAHTFIFVAGESKYRCINEDFNNNTCGSVNGKQCSEWIYEDPLSFVAEFELACQEWKRTLVGTVHSFGYMLGLLIVGPMSDRIGRKRTIIWTGMLGAVIGAVKSFSHSYWLYVTLEFMGSLIGDCYSPLYMLNLEIVSAKKRVIFHYLCNFGSYIGGVLLPLSAWGMTDWRKFLQTVYFPAIPVIACFFFIDESPRWLLSKGKKEKTIAVVNKMGQKNKIKLNKDKLDNLLIEDEENNIDFVSVLKMTIRSRTLLKRCLVCIVWWITSTLVYYGVMINSVSLEGNKYVNYGLNQLVQVPGNFIIMYVLHNYKRKIPLMSSFFTAAVLCFIQPLLPNSLPWLSVTVYLANTLMTALFFGITYIFTSELFPTYTRNSMHALCSSVGRIGSILAPQTPLLMAYWSGFPALLFGCASLTAGLVTFLVPDTADNCLPNTVREAKNVGKKNKRDITGVDNLGLALD